MVNLDIAPGTQVVLTQRVAAANFSQVEAGSVGMVLGTTETPLTGHRLALSVMVADQRVIVWPHEVTAA